MVGSNRKFLQIFQQILLTVQWKLSSTRYTFLILFVSGTNYWLNWWSNDTFHDFCKTDKNCRDFYLGVYGAFGFGQAIGVMTLSITIAITTLNASMQMHKVCLERVLKGPMEFFDTTPLGRIVNRY